MAKKKSEPLPPSIEAVNEALAAIRRTTMPVTAKQLSALLIAPNKIAEKTLIPILETVVSKGELHSFPPATAKGQPRFWDRGLVEFASCSIVQMIEKKGPQPKAKLKTAIKGLSDDQFQQAFQNLIASRKLQEHPPVGSSKTVKYGTEPPVVEPYLKDLGTKLAKVIERLIAAGVHQRSLRTAIDAWLAKGGMTTGQAAESEAERPTLQVNQIDLLMLMRQIEPGADRGALVTARELRRAASLDKAEFDRLVLETARQGRLMLHRHDHAAGLSPTERDELVTDGAGVYYVGMALRRMES